MPVTLELISRLPKRGTARPTPVLFIHGAFAGAWCWAEYFLDYFSRHGYSAYALSLRGHGKSQGRERLWWTSLQEYVADVEQVVAGLQVAPVMVGHSMGGMIMQKYLERAPIPAAVLMAPVPPEGLIGVSSWLALRDPLLFQEINLIQFFGPHFATLDGAHRAIFSPDMPIQQVVQYFGRMQPESQRAMMDMVWLDLPRLPDALPPALVLGGERDVLIPPAFLATTARAFSAQLQIFPGMAHAMMLEAGWRSVADGILEWLREIDV